MKDFSPKATLFIHLHEHPVDDDDDVDGAVKVTFSVRDDRGKTEANLPADTAQEFLDNGLYLAIIEELINGLSRERGTSIPEAVENATRRMQQADQAINLEDFLDRLKLGLADPQGEC